MTQTENSFKWELPIKSIDTPAGDKPNYYEFASKIIDKAVKYNVSVFLLKNKTHFII